MKENLPLPSFVIQIIRKEKYSDIFFAARTLKDLDYLMDLTKHYQPGIMRLVRLANSDNVRLVSILDRYSVEEISANLLDCTMEAAIYTTRFPTIDEFKPELCPN